MPEQSLRESLLDQAKAYREQAWSLPKPPNTGNVWKDFLLNALQTAPMALGAKMAPMATIGPKLIPGKGFKSDLGVKQPSGAGIAENTNPFSPVQQKILDFLGQSNIPIKNIKDTSGGTTYIKALDPYSNKSGELTIRVPEDEHIGKYTNKIGDFFDTGNLRTKGGGRNTPLTRNAEGGDYNNIDNLLEALKHRTSSAPGQENWLVAPGKQPVYPRTKEINPVLPLEKSNQLELPLNISPKGILPSEKLQELHSLIDQRVSKNNVLNMEQPQLTNQEMQDMSTRISDVLRRYNFTKE